MHLALVLQHRAAARIQRAWHGRAVPIVAGFLGVLPSLSYVIAVSCPLLLLRDGGTEPIAAVATLAAAR
ncbi:hypothetical protein [Pseudarthrobacter sulfonivorans]|uniref:hypothetical protein n=1 Tax=Pseudarthrobacter sulfonivorans TaxID=121292 RepID=UPI00286546DD|nr:hypothetical protein [Pseudarthrobacter sulfonivorans]MDR6417744.1 hypothetical protein [Pseudarthrobacter sulfonivorans]